MPAAKAAASGSNTVDLCGIDLQAKEDEEHCGEQ
jgi:hypothetical protein